MPAPTYYPDLIIIIILYKSFLSFLENQLMKLFTLFSSRSTSIDDGEDEVEDDDSDEIMVATIHQNYQSHNRMTKVQTMY